MTANRNLPTLRAIAGDPTILAALPLDALDQLFGEIDAETKITAFAKKAIVAHIEKSYAGDITHAYAAMEKDFGTVRVTDAGYDIVVDTPKKVEWDQTALADILERIKFSGDDPSEYIKTTLSVDERAFTAWPAHIRKTIEPARTVKPGSRTVKLVRREAQEAA